MADINKVLLVGRLTRDAEQSYTPNGFPLLKFSVAVNKRKKIGDQWGEEGHFFDVTSYGKQAESLAAYLVKGKQIAIEGSLRQDRWVANDGQKRNKVSIDASYIQLVGNRDGNTRPAGSADRNQNNSSWEPPHAGGNEQDQYGGNYGGSPASMPSQDFEDDIPF